MNILLSQVTGVASSKECALLKTCRYWHTDLRLISPHILETVHKELEQDHGHVTADRCMKALDELAQICQMYFSGRHRFHKSNSLLQRQGVIE